MKETKQIKCWSCDGHGLVGNWAHGVLERDECATCNGSGSIVQYVASGRLPIGDPNAPHQARFADTRKYDGLSMGDLAFVAGILDATKRRDGSHPGISVTALKALAIKIAEDKTAIGAEGRSSMKACGIEPADTLDAAKASG